MLKKLYNYLIGNKVEDKFWLYYKGEANLYKKEEENEEYELFLENCYITFDEDINKNFDYFLNFTSREDPESRYCFHVSNKMKPRFQIQEEEHSIIFEMQIEKCLYIKIEFIIKNEDYEDCGQFRQIFSRLLYEHKNRTFSTNLPEEEFLSYIQEKTFVNFSEDIEVVYNEIQNPNLIFTGIGSFSKIEEEDAPPEIIEEESIFTIKDNNNFNYSFLIFDKKKNKIYEKGLSNQLSYYINDVTNTLTWIDIDGEEVVCYNFSFYKKNIKELVIKIQICFMEFTKKTNYTEILQKEKNNWDQFYLGKDQVMGEEEMEVIKEYGGDKDEDFDFEETEENENGPQFDSPIINFVQGKNSHRYFTNRGDLVNVYKVNEIHNGFDYLTDLPILKTLEGDRLYPKKLELHQDDKQLLFLDQNINNKIFNYDITKGKIVNEFDTDKYNKMKIDLKDLTLHGGKEGMLKNDSLFMAIGEKDIYEFDTRMENYKINQKSYKTNMGFKKILTTKGEHFTIGSSNGEIRMFNKLGENAKNLLPSYKGDEIVDMDSTQDGKFLLLTFRDYLMLFPTFRGDKNVFEYTFQKVDKPIPKILKISPKLLKKLNISEINFKSSRFNESENKKENFIIATMDRYLFFWNLSKVLNNKYITNKCHTMEDFIVQGEFLYNEDNLVTALTHNLVLQKANLHK